METGLSKWRPRYSLLALLAVVPVACLAVSYWQTARQLAITQAELRQLRNEASYLSKSGSLVIDDRTEFHAAAIDCVEPNTWRWRIFVPKGSRYRWNVACHDIPRNALPAKAGMMGFPNSPYWQTENEVLVTVRVREADEGQWLLSVTSRIVDSEHQMAGVKLMIPPEDAEWLSSVPSVENHVIGARGTEVCDADDPIVLLRRRACEKQPDGSYYPSEEPMPGFMVWLCKWDL